MREYIGAWTATLQFYRKEIAIVVVVAIGIVGFLYALKTVQVQGV